MKVNEIFFSLQGEGLYIGVPMAFVRFTGCNLRCKWCDTKYAWEEGSEMSMDNIISDVKKYPTNWVCLTGGEPLLQKDIYKLIDKFLSMDYKVLVETNGSMSIENIPCEENVIIDMDIKTPSSGMSQFNDYSNIEMLGSKDYVKFVIQDDVDYNFMKDILKNYEFKCEAIAQPEGNKNLKYIAEKVISDGLKLRVLPQLHKIIWGDKHGV
ncbi:MAG: 7-carboxy-7-deazaguanine synthase QueE [Thermoplasmata archaeon]